MKLNFKPAFGFQFKEVLSGSITVFAVNVAIVVASLIAVTLWQGGKVSYNAYGIVCAITLFVFGIVVPRQHLRLCIQFGVSRRTAFLGNLAAAVVNAGILAAAGEVLLTTARTFFAQRGRVEFSDLYQLAYLGGDPTVALTAGQHVGSILLNITVMLACFGAGIFLTFLFWRLNKVGTVVVAICIPVLLTVVPVFGVSLSGRVPVFGRGMKAFFSWIATAPWHAMLLMVLLAVVLYLLSWLLVRRANIKAPSSG